MDTLIFTVWAVLTAFVTIGTTYVYLTGVMVFVEASGPVGYLTAAPIVGLSVAVAALFDRRHSRRIR